MFLNLVNVGRYFDGLQMNIVDPNGIQTFADIGINNVVSGFRDFEIPLVKDGEFGKDGLSRFDVLAFHEDGFVLVHSYVDFGILGVFLNTKNVGVLFVNKVANRIPYIAVFDPVEQIE
jgi:hypothetical protein